MTTRKSSFPPCPEHKSAGKMIGQRIYACLRERHKWKVGERFLRGIRFTTFRTNASHAQDYETRRRRRWLWWKRAGSSWHRYGAVDWRAAIVIFASTQLQSASIVMTIMRIRSWSNWRSGKKGEDESLSTAPGSKATQFWRQEREIHAWRRVERR